jgi:hypothetical protein
MKMIDAVGYLAAGPVLATFCMRSMSSLRLVAIAGNLAFITYGYLGNLTPVPLLHALLLPVNAGRLVQLCWLNQRRKHLTDGPRVRGGTLFEQVCRWMTRQKTE